MKVLIYFSGKLGEPKGTPIRTRNQIAALLKEGADVFYAGHEYPENLKREKVFLLPPPLMRFLALPAFVRTQDIDLVYFQTSAGIWYVPFIALFTRARAGIDFHSRRYQEEHVYKKRSYLHTALKEALELLLCRFLSFGTAVSGTITSYYARVVPHLETFPVGVDIARFSPGIMKDVETLEWKGNATLIAYAGNTKWYQGVEGVLEAFASLSKEQEGQWKFLVIASSGVEDVVAYAKTHGLTQHMRILDKQPHEAIPGLLGCADVLTVVRPSDMVTEFSFPSKLPEYAALGKALIVSRVSDIESYIHDGENGLVVPPSDPVALRSALATLADPTLRARLGSAARRVAEEQFALPALGARLYRFLKERSDTL